MLRDPNVVQCLLCRQSLFSSVKQKQRNARELQTDKPELKVKLHKIHDNYVDNHVFDFNR